MSRCRDTGLGFKGLGLRVSGWGFVDEGGPSEHWRGFSESRNTVGILMVGSRILISPFLGGKCWSGEMVTKHVQETNMRRAAHDLVCVCFPPSSHGKPLVQLFNDERCCFPLTALLCPVRCSALSVHNLP